MATSKTYSVAGTSVLGGKLKLRFANDLLRTKVLSKAGHTNIKLVELPVEMTKSEAVEHLKSINFANGDTEIEMLLNDQNEPVAKVSKTKSAETPVEKINTQDFEPALM